MLCRTGLRFGLQIQVQGLLGITVDSKDVFLVHIDESIAKDDPLPVASLPKRQYEDPTNMFSQSSCLNVSSCRGGVLLDRSRSDSKANSSKICSQLPDCQSFDVSGTPLALHFAANAVSIKKCNDAADRDTNMTLENSVMELQSSGNPSPVEFVSVAGDIISVESDEDDTYYQATNATFRPNDAVEWQMPLSGGHGCVMQTDGGGLAGVEGVGRSPQLHSSVQHSDEDLTAQETKVDLQYVTHDVKPLKHSFSGANSWRRQQQQKRVRHTERRVGGFQSEVCNCNVTFMLHV